MKHETENIVKKTAKELGLTYKELAEEIGYSEDAIKKAVRPDSEISKPMQKAISLLLANNALKKEMEDLKQLRTILRKIIK